MAIQYFDDPLSSAQSAGHKVQTRQSPEAEQAQGRMSDRTVTAEGRTGTPPTDINPSPKAIKRHIKTRYIETVGSQTQALEDQYRQMKAHAAEISRAYLYLGTQTVTSLKRYKHDVTELLQPMLKRDRDVGSYYHMDTVAMSERDGLSYLQAIKTFLDSPKAREYIETMNTSVVTMMKMYKHFWLISSNPIILDRSLCLSQASCSFMEQGSLYQKFRENGIPEVLFNPSVVSASSTASIPELYPDDSATFRSSLYAQEERFKEVTKEYCSKLKKTSSSIEDTLKRPDSLKDDQETQPLEEAALDAHRTWEWTCNFSAYEAPYSRPLLILSSMQKDMHDSLKALAGVDQCQNNAFYNLLLSGAATALGSYSPCTPTNDDRKAFYQLTSSLYLIDQHIRSLQHNLGLKEQSTPEATAAHTKARYEAACKEKNNFSDQLWFLFHGESKPTPSRFPVKLETLRKQFNKHIPDRQAEPAHPQSDT